MGRPHIVRFHLYRNNTHPSSSWYDENTNTAMFSSRCVMVQRVGYVIVYDVSGSSYCEERECPLYEIRNTIIITHNDETNHKVRASRLLVTYAFTGQQISMNILPERFEYFCQACQDEPNSAILCLSCNEFKRPFISITDCFSRPEILSALAPQTYHVEARHGNRPYAEELFAAALHPNRKDLWDSVLDYEDALDLKNNWAN